MLDTNTRNNCLSVVQYVPKEIYVVIPNPQPLNPNADEFKANVAESDQPQHLHLDHCANHVHFGDFTTHPLMLDGYVYMNGDVGKLPSGAVFSATPETGASLGSVPEYVAVNGVTEGAEGLSPIPPSAPHDNASQSAYPLPQLKQMLSQQLEYYFSRENLANDTYLLSQMDNDQYVPIWTVANFNQVKKLTKDIKLITEVLRESPNVQVDEEGVKVRPNHKRCIVILREIPDSTPLEDVKNLFAGENCPRFISCEFAHNSNWYVTFESDEDAQRAYKYLREEIREFQGKPIMARIKAKPMNRLPMAPVPSAAVKNGFRATPPPTAVFDPAAYPPGQQRFIYANGTPGQPPVAYNQVPIYPYPQQQFYASSMASWPQPGFYDISTVFQVNGLAPQTFKPPPYRSNTRQRKQPSRTANQSDQSSQGSSQGGAVGGGSSQSTSRPTSQVPQSVSPHGKTNHNSGSVVSSGKPPPQQVPSGTGVLPAVPVGAGVPSVDNNGAMRPGHVHNLVVTTGDNNHDGHANAAPIEYFCYTGLPLMPIDMAFIPLPLPGKEPPPRHRRKKRDEEMPSAGSQTLSTQTASMASTATTTGRESGVNARGAQFDLVEEAFPPLPGLDAGNQSMVKQSQVANMSVEVAQSQAVAESQPQGHWGENRLADVVKGTVKSKGGGSSKESSTNDNDSPRATSPQHQQHYAQCTATRHSSTGTVAQQTDSKDASESSSGHIQLSTVTLTPPSSPEKLIPMLTTKCTMADKSTKTDDALLNGELDLPCPTTTNAATMTTVVPTEAPSRPAQVTASTSMKAHQPVHRQDSRSETSSKQPPPASPPPLAEYSGNPPRMSYAQVAQHHKDAQKEKQMKEKQTETVATMATATVPPCHVAGKPTTATSTNSNSSSNSGRVPNERDSFKESKDNGQQQRGDNAGLRPSSRGGGRGGGGGHDRSQRRRTAPGGGTQLRDYVPRSPK